MLIIEINRDDLFPYCRKIDIDQLTFREVDPQKLSSRDFSKADMVYFTDSDGSKKVLKNKKKKK
jgi:hypothetical protein